MPSQVPFVAYINVVPHRGQQTKLPDTPNTVAVSRRGGRFDYMRDLQRLAVLVYDDLRTNVDFTGIEDDIELAQPGGGQFSTRSEANNRYGSMPHGMAITPQFGNQPSMLSVPGFFKADSPESAQPAANITRIHAGDFVQGPAGQQPHLGTAGNPTAVVEAEVTTLKAALEGAISTIADELGTGLTLFRLEYKGIIWGIGGHHFPR